MVKNNQLMKKHDLSSVRHVITGAAPLGNETAEDLHKLQPSWSILQAYGMLHAPICIETIRTLTAAYED